MKLIWCKMSPIRLLMHYINCLLRSAHASLSCNFTSESLRPLRQLRVAMHSLKLKMFDVPLKELSDSKQFLRRAKADQLQLLLLRNRRQLHLLLQLKELNQQRLNHLLYKRHHRLRLGKCHHRVLLVKLHHKRLLVNHLSHLRVHPAQLLYLLRQADLVPR
jgi:hypothetical protein